MFASTTTAIFFLVLDVRPFGAFLANTSSDPTRKNFTLNLHPSFLYEFFSLNIIIYICVCVTVEFMLFEIVK